MHGNSMHRICEFSLPSSGNAKSDCQCVEQLQAAPRKVCVCQARAERAPGMGLSYNICEAEPFPAASAGPSSFDEPDF